MVETLRQFKQMLHQFNELGNRFIRFYCYKVCLIFPCNTPNLVSLHPVVVQKSDRNDFLGDEGRSPPVLVIISVSVVS